MQANDIKGLPKTCACHRSVWSVKSVIFLSPLFINQFFVFLMNHKHCACAHAGEKN